MNLYDVNVLVYAYRDEFPEHPAVRRWLDRESGGPAAFMMSDLVLSAFVRVVTNPGTFKIPTPMDLALRQAKALRDNPLCVPVNPGPTHFEIFARLCRQANVAGRRTSDAYHAAVAIEHNATWLSFDRDFARFPGLDWAVPDCGA